MQDSGNLDNTFSTYDLGDWALQSTETLRSASIAYKLIGPVDAPVIVYPTWFSALISDNFYFLNSSVPILSTSQYRILIPALFGNSQSTSPSTSAQRPFPAITIADNVRAQWHLLQHLQISSIYAAVGWSMGGMTAIAWAASHPVKFSSNAAGAIAICATASCSPHNSVFLEGVKGALLAGIGRTSSGIGVKEYIDIPIARSETSLKAMARVYAGWGFSQAFYRKELWRNLGYSDLDDWFRRFWETWACSKDIENLLCMIQTWQTADISRYSLEAVATLQDTKIPVLMLPGALDLYFQSDDAAEDASRMPLGECHVIPGEYGHWAGGPGGSNEDLTWIAAQVKTFLDAKTTAT